MRVEVFVEENM